MTDAPISTSERCRPRASRQRRLVVAFVAFAVVAAGCGTNKDEGEDTTAPTVNEVSCDALAGDGGLPITYAQAKQGGCEGEFDWGEHCDTATGRLKLPTANPLDCVPVFTGDNGGETSPGVSADTIRIARYVAVDDPATAAFLNDIGARDEPEQIAETYNNFLALFNTVAQTYGRQLEVVELEASGSATDAVAARADAKKAVELGVFAVISGPAQTRAFSEELARNRIINVGGAVGSGAFYRENSPYVWAIGPTPEQTAARTTEFITKQLVGKPAEFAGDEFKDQERSFVLLTYDDAESNFEAPWNDWLAELQAAGVPVNDERVEFTLDLARAAEDTQVVVQKLKDINATTVVFTGDPIMPAFFSKEMTAQGYFPEWVLSGTVYADTTVLARGYDPEQWKHAMGISLIPARIPRDQSDAIVLYRWWTGAAPPAENTAAIISANLTLLYTGIHFAGPNLTPETFRDAIFARPIPDRVDGDVRGTITYGRDDIWDAGTDFAGLDDIAIIWWDPEAGGEDETGEEGTGQYRYILGGDRFLPGEIPEEPLPLFVTEGSVTYYSDESGAPDGTLPVPDYIKTNPDKYPKPS
jgi:hypothetical protein